MRNQQHSLMEESREKLEKTFAGVTDFAFHFCMWAQKKPSKETLVIIIR